MGEGFQFIDIILFAMIAAFLVLRLRSVLGRRDGHEGGHIDPFRPRPRSADEPGTADDKVIALPERKAAATPGAAPEAGPLEAGLDDIRRHDSSFRLGDFLSGARLAFEMVLAAFAEGNKATLKPLLSPEVFGNFTRAIDQRERAGETLERTLVGIKDTDAVEAFVDGRVANVTVKFVSEQINVTRNTAGEVVEGEPGKVAEITDFWTFARDTGSRDPNWILVGTRSLE